MTFHEKLKPSMIAAFAAALLEVASAAVAQSPPPRSAVGTCEVFGEVTSKVGYRHEVRDHRKSNVRDHRKDNVRDHRQKKKLHVLDVVFIRTAVGSKWISTPLHGDGTTRNYSFRGLRPGVRYEVDVPGDWGSTPGRLTFTCPRGGGTQRMRLEKIVVTSVPR